MLGLYYLPKPNSRWYHRVNLRRNVLATTVYTVEEITLQDGTEATLRPLNIKGLRKFMAKMDEFGDVKTDDEGMEILLDAAAICLMKDRPEFWDKDKDRGFKPLPEDAEEGAEPEPKSKGGYAEEFEDVVDMPTVYHIIDKCGGIKLDDPKLMEAAVAALGATST